MSFLSLESAKAREYFPRGLVQPEGSFRFSADALLLAAYAAHCRKNWNRLADLGCGAGAVAFGTLLLSGSLTQREALGLDLHQELVDAANENASLLGLDETFAAKTADFLFYQTGGLSGRFDLVTANPPYRFAGSGRLPKSILRRDALFGNQQNLAAFIRVGESLLTPDGVFCLIFPIVRLPELERLLLSAGLLVSDCIAVSAHKEEAPALALLSARRGGGAESVVSSPSPKKLVLYEEDSAGEKIISRDALSFCRFLSCNIKG